MIMMSQQLNLKRKSASSQMPPESRMKKQKEDQAAQLENRMAKLDVTIAQKKRELAQLDFQLAELDQQELELNARLANGGRQLKLANFWAVEASAPGVRISDGGMVAELSSNEVTGNVRAKFPLIKTRVPYFEVRIVAQKPVEDVRGMENQAKNAIPSNDYHIFSQYCQNIANRHNRYLAITDEHWKSTSSEQTLCSCFKLQQNFDGTFGIYSSFKGKFLENGNTGSELGLTEDCTANSAKFEFQYVGQDMFYDMNRMVKIRSIGGNGYLRLDQSGQQSGDFHVTIIPASKDATVFTLVPAYDLCALLKK